jgi:hypothetical protein
MKSLLYTFLEEFIFLFGTEFIVYKKIEILDFDREAFRIRARGYGEEFNKEKHPQGTEIKARTLIYICAHVMGMLLIVAISTGNHLLSNGDNRRSRKI